MRFYGKKETSFTTKFALLLVLLLVLVSFLTSCATANSKQICHAWPVGGKKVAHELEKVCYNKDENICPALFEWMNRLDKLRQQIEVCKG